VTAGRPGLAVAIITLDEERRLPACLESVRFADEIVVCDSGSADRTLEIAAAFGARTYRDAWRGFAAHKSLAVERCGQPWVLVLDADERVPPALRAEIEAVLRADGPADGYTIGRRNYFLGSWIRHGGWSPDRSVRLIRQGRGRFLPRAVHEAIEVQGRLEALREPMEHYSYDSVGDYLRRMERYAALAAAEMHAAGRRCRVTDLTLRPVWTFLRMYLLQRGCLDGRPGLILAGLYAGYTFAKYAALWGLAGEPGSMGAGGQGSRGAEEPRSRGAGR
jgi:glycosyltransferase involved in cell wall biosynthesis